MPTLKYQKILTAICLSLSLYIYKTKSHICYPFAFNRIEIFHTGLRNRLYGASSPSSLSSRTASIMCLAEYILKKFPQSYSPPPLLPYQGFNSLKCLKTWCGNSITTNKSRALSFTNQNVFPACTVFKQKQPL